MAKKKKSEKWIKFRHRVVRNIAFAILAPYSRLKYGFKAEKFKDSKNRSFLIVFNHQTAFDQFFVGMAFSGSVYYVASEDLFSKGWVSSLIRYLVAPIPIKKQTTDIKAIKNCIRVAKEGGTIAVAPEGNRTYSGKTEHMNSSIASLARKLGMPVAVYKIEGGYGVHPRWSDVIRKGKMRGYVSRVIEPEEYKDLTNEEFFDIIEKELYVNECVEDQSFYHKKSAEYLERVFYVCPYCGLAEFESHDDIIQCKTCKRQVRYLPTKRLEGVGFDFDFPFTNEWYEYQKDFVNNLDVLEYTDKPLHTGRAQFSQVIVYKKKNILIKDAKLTLYGDRIEVEGEQKFVFSFDETNAVTVLGKNKLNLYFGKDLYQIKSDERFNALKYVNVFHRHKNILKGDANGKFLGL